VTRFAADVDEFEVIDEGALEKRNDAHDRLGRFARKPGTGFAPTKTEATGSTVAPLTLTRVHGQRAFSGDQKLTRRNLTKAQTGALGERIIAAYYGGNVRSLNIGRNNAPIDLRAGDKLIEAKSGLVSNRVDSQKWRSTIGEPGKAEKAWLKGLSPEAKRAWNEQKMREIIRRKYDAVRKVSTVLGRAFKATTVCTIINPDTRMADVFEMPGFHRNIRWNSPELASAYKGTFKYQ
jgi:hypothetical protein